MTTGRGKILGVGSDSGARDALYENLLRRTAWAGPAGGVREADDEAARFGRTREQFHDDGRKYRAEKLGFGSGEQHRAV